MLTSLVHIIVLGVALVFAGLTLASRLTTYFQFWPPANVESWQYISFRWLFRVFFLGLVLLSVLEFGDPATWKLAVGVPLLGVGFGLALHWTGFLGWRNAFGEARGLKTEGAYRWSRNPIYIASLVGMLGWAFVVDSWRVTSVLFLWAVFYVVAPFLEEPWMEQQYGDEYRSYRSRVPRFFKLWQSNTR